MVKRGRMLRILWVPALAGTLSLTLFWVAGTSAKLDPLEGGGLRSPWPAVKYLPAEGADLDGLFSPDWSPGTGASLNVEAIMDIERRLWVLDGLHRRGRRVRLDPLLTGREHLRLYARLRGLPEEDVKRVSQDSLHAFFQIIILRMCPGMLGLPLINY